MTDKTGNKAFTTTEAIEFFKSRINRLSGETTREAYRKALMQFQGFASAQSLSDETITQTVLEDWYVAMRFRGLTAKTASYYLDNICSMYASAVKEDKTAPTDDFSNVRAKLKAIDERDSPFLVTDSHVRKLKSLCPAPGAENNSVVPDTILISLVNGCMPLREVATIKKDTLANLNPQGNEIARRNIDAKRKYIFPLGQTLMTPRQAESHLVTEITECLKVNGIPVVSTPMGTIKSLWAFTALKSGATASDVVSVLGEAPAGMPILSICKPNAVGESMKKALYEMVAEAICRETTHWYAMRLRPRVGFDDVLKRFSSKATDLKKPEMFYPCREIARRIGKKLVWQEKPIISDVVFFKSRPSEIYPMFMQLWDLAWCYRTDRERRGSYAIIPDAAMQLFQETIGKFTPEYEVAPMGQLILRPDDRVVVIGGDYAGLTGKILETDKNGHDEGNTVYRIMLLGANGGKWNVGIDARLIRPQQQ